MKWSLAITENDVPPQNRENPKIISIFWAQYIAMHSRDMQNFIKSGQIEKQKDKIPIYFYGTRKAPTSDHFSRSIRGKPRVHLAYLAAEDIMMGATFR